MPAQNQLTDGSATPPGGAAQRIAHALREQIVEGRLAPGFALREDKLAEELGVSRNTLREGLRVLAAEGLVVSYLHKGTAVASLTTEAVRDIFIVRRSLELRAIEDSTMAPRERFVAMAQAVDASERAAKAGDWALVSTTGLRFHQAVVGLLNSERLDRFFRTILAQLRLGYSQAGVAADLHAGWVERDRRIVDFVLSGQREAAAEEMRLYLEDSERHVMDIVRRHAALSELRAARVGGLIER